MQSSDSSSSFYPDPKPPLPSSMAIKRSPSFPLECAETDVTHSSIMSESITQGNNFKSIEVLDLSNFKIQPCMTKMQHNYKTCFFFHNAKDRRRTGTFFSSELCEYGERTPELCPMGDFCPKSHNRLEQLYHAEKYKTKFCSHFPSYTQNCEYGVYCSFAHSESEILIDLIHNYDFDEDFFLFHYKTIWCPFNLTQHDKGLCVYAHNWQDFRRKPNLYNYEPVSCANWNHNKIIVNYEDGCMNSFSCLNCHGWKENEFHPLNYRTKPCPNIANCTRGFACPFYHVVKDKRIISPNVQTQFFKFFPRNRILSGTFKVRRSSCTLIRKPSINGGNNFPNLIPVMEEFEKEKESKKNLNFQGERNGEENNFSDSKNFFENVGYNITPKKKNNFNEGNRTQSESLNRMNLSEEELKRKDYKNVQRKSLDVFLERQISQLKEFETANNNNNNNNCNDSDSNDDFSDLVYEINKITGKSME